MIPESILSFFHAGKSLPFRSMTFFNFLLEATLAGSILIIVMLILRRMFRKQIGSRLVYLAWALVAIRLLVPIALPNPLMDEFRPTLSMDAGARPVADQFRVRFQDTLSTTSIRMSLAAEENGTPLERSVAGFARDLSIYSSYGWLGKGYLLCYGSISLLVAAVFTARHFRFRHKLKKNAVSTLEGEQLSLYQDLCKQLGVKQLPVLYVDPLPSPCLIGVVKPIIALPLTLPPESLREALMHEMYHHKAKDSWWVLVRCACCAIHWFNPLVWIGQRTAQTDCELACDERVSAKLSYEERLHYANTLVVTAKQTYAPRCGVLATGMTMTGKRLKWRINAIVRMKAVQKAWASLVAIMLVVLTVAAFSTAESTGQTKRLTSDPSAFAFSENDSFSVPEGSLGETVSLSAMRSIAEAEAQAKRYLCALFPEEREAIETQYTYHIQSTSGDTSWQISVFSPQYDTHLYHLDIENSGRLYYLTRTNVIANGEDIRSNIPSVLPTNFKSVLLAYGQRVSEAVLQSTPLDQVAIRSDFETENGRYVELILSDPANPSNEVCLTVQVAPTFRLNDVSQSYGGADAPPRQPIEPEIHSLTYSADPSITFGAIYWGQTDSAHMLGENPQLTLQQAFDIAVDTMLEKSGLSKEAFLALTLEYGYLDEARVGGVNSTWRFSWRVDDVDANRYWIDFLDSPTPPDISLYFPGEGLG